MRAPGGINADAVHYYADGAWYDAEYIHIRYDVPYYVRVGTETKGRILELACGTGRLTIPMIQAGAQVLGVDISEGMIAEANRKRARLPAGDQARVEFRVGDMRALRYPDKFEAVVLAFNTLMHMIDDDDLAATLETARAHLAPGGLFHLDLHTPFPQQEPRDPSERYDPTQVIDPKTRQRWVVSEGSSYDARTQINTMKFYYQRVDQNGKTFGEEHARTLELRVIFPRELDRWLHQHGFEIVGDWDDLEREKPFTGTGGRRMVMARKR